MLGKDAVELHPAGCYGCWCFGHGLCRQELKEEEHYV